MIPLYACALPRICINRHIALVYRYSPKCFHGLGLKHLYTDQGIEQIKMLLSHGGTDSYCGILIQCCYELLQLEVGTLTSFFNLDYSKYSFLCTESYIKSVWKYADEKDIQLFAPVNIPQPCRVNDVSLIEAVMEHKEKFTEQEILMLNRCKLYLNVLYLSDITTGNGEQVTEQAFDCAKDPYRHSSIKWRYQPRPSEEMISKWKMILSTIFINFGNALKKR